MAQNADTCWSDGVFLLGRGGIIIDIYSWYSVLLLTFEWIDAAMDRASYLVPAGYSMSVQPGYRDYRKRFITHDLLVSYVQELGRRNFSLSPRFLVQS